MYLPFPLSLSCVDIRHLSSQMTRPPPSPDLLRMRFPVIVHPLSRVTCWQVSEPSFGTFNQHTHLTLQELKDFGRLAGGVVAFCDVDKVRARGYADILRIYPSYISSSSLPIALSNTSLARTLKGRLLSSVVVNSMEASSHSLLASVPKFLCSFI